MLCLSLSTELSREKTEELAFNTQLFKEPLLDEFNEEESCYYSKVGKAEGLIEAIVTAAAAEKGLAREGLDI